MKKTLDLHKLHFSSFINEDGKADIQIDADKYNRLVDYAFKNNISLEIDLQSDIDKYDEILNNEKTTISELKDVKELILERIKYIDMKKDTYFLKLYNDMLLRVDEKISNFSNIVDSLPPHLGYNLEKDVLKEEFEKWCKGLIDKETDFVYFAYALNGDKIPFDKLPYKPIKLQRPNSYLYKKLFDLQQKYDKEQKVLTYPRKKNSPALFLSKNLQPAILSNPKK